MTESWALFLHTMHFRQLQTADFTSEIDCCHETFSLSLQIGGRMSLSLSCPRFFLPILALAGALSVQSAAAEERLNERFEIRGYAHQGFLLNSSKTNVYHKADQDGTLDFNALALLFSFKATDDLSIWAQLYANSESTVRLDWAFADYRVNDWLRIRGGQIKNPVGLLNDIRDIKYLQSSTLEPLIYQEPADMVFEAIRGASAYIEKDTNLGTFKLDLFAGAPVFFETEEMEEKQFALFGSRLTYDTPLEGLSIGGSIYANKERDDEEESRGSKTFLGASLEYKLGGAHLSGEYFRLRGMERTKYGYYAEAAYTFSQLTPFVRYDYLTTDSDYTSDPMFYQKEVVVGVGYKFNQFASIKAENHFIRGYALPQREYKEANDENLEDGEKNWNLFAVSLNLMF